MKKPVRLLIFLLLLILLGGVSVRLLERARSERRHHAIALVVDWGEIRELAARAGSFDTSLLDALKIQGATGVLLPSTTLNELISAGRVVPQLASAASSPLDTTQVYFKDAALAEAVKTELGWRGVSGLQVVRVSPGAGLRSAGGSFEALKDIDAGFDPAIMSLLEEKRLVPLLRLNNDPWTQTADIPPMLERDPALARAGAILFNTDDLPGGLEALPYWRSWLAQNGKLIPLFEFHPAKAAQLLARHLPRQAVRSHTIPALELKDLGPGEAIARWNRAAIERTCRVFLVHASPSDSWPSYLDRLGQLHASLLSQGWEVRWPEAEALNRPLHHAFAEAFGLLAFFIALITPWVALERGRRAGWGSRGFWITAFWTTVGGSCVAALGWNAWTRLEIVPLRGIKLAFLLGWLGAAFVIYRVSELRALLAETVRRRDLLVAAFVVAVIGYIMIRSGNASAGWKSPMEGGIRSFLERLLIARPRFKEFAIGHPLLLIGYLLERRRAAGASADGRLWILTGMMGQASIVNTFCHLHSPIVLAFLRTGIGLGLGWMIGRVLVTFFPSAFNRSQRA